MKDWRDHVSLAALLSWFLLAALMTWAFQRRPLPTAPITSWRQSPPSGTRWHIRPSRTGLFLALGVMLALAWAAFSGNLHGLVG
jgi:hypothetical protein